MGCDREGGRKNVLIRGCWIRTGREEGKGNISYEFSRRTGQ